jgi:general secretion pathway protein G
MGMRQRFQYFYRRRQKADKIRGFTLLEIVIAMAIIAVLAAIAVPNYLSMKDKARFDDTVQEIRDMGALLDLWYMERDKYPDNLAEAGLDDRRDQWDQPYRYFSVANAGNNGQGLRKDKDQHPLNTDYDLYSIGPDGRTNLPLTDSKSYDDIIRANNGAFVGWASDY